MIDKLFEIGEILQIEFFFRIFLLLKKKILINCFFQNSTKYLHQYFMTKKIFVFISQETIFFFKSFFKKYSPFRLKLVTFSDFHRSAKNLLPL